jgi:hypothetical protein
MKKLIDENKMLIVAYGRDLLEANRTGLHSFEQASQRVCESIFKGFSTEDGGGDPIFALVRVYRLTRTAELPSELAALTDPSRDRYLALMGTYGQEPAWCDRHQSVGHKLLNLGADQSPMVSAAFHQLGLEVGIEMPSVGMQLPLYEGVNLTRDVFLPDVEGSPFVPAQDGFVKPYGIRAVCGMGTVFVSGSAYLLLAFARVPFDRNMMDHFSRLSPFVGTLLANYDDGQLWA